MIYNNAAMTQRSSSPSRPQAPASDSRSSGGQLFSMRDPHRKSAPASPPSPKPEKK